MATRRAAVCWVRQASDACSLCQHHHQSLITHRTHHSSYSSLIINHSNGPTAPSSIKSSLITSSYSSSLITHHSSSLILMGLPPLGGRASERQFHRSRLAVTRWPRPTNLSRAHDTHCAREQPPPPGPPPEYQWSKRKNTHVTTLSSQTTDNIISK